MADAMDEISMHLDARVSESDISRVLREQKAEIRINAYRDEVFDGDVTRIALQRTMDGSGAGYFMTEVHLNLRGRSPVLRRRATAHRRSGVARCPHT